MCVCALSFPPSDRISGANSVSVTVLTNHQKPRFATHKLQLKAHAHFSQLMLSSLGCYKGLNGGLKASSADPTCLSSLWVIVPLLKITFLAFSFAGSHHILSCDCVYYVKADHSDVPVQHYAEEAGQKQVEACECP